MSSRELTGVLRDQLLWSVPDSKRWYTRVPKSPLTIILLNLIGAVSQHRIRAREHITVGYCPGLCFDTESPGPASDIYSSLDREAASILHRHTLCCSCAVTMTIIGGEDNRELRIELVELRFSSFFLKFVASSECGKSDLRPGLTEPTRCKQEFPSDQDMQDMRLCRHPAPNSFPPPLIFWPGPIATSLLLRDITESLSFTFSHSIMVSSSPQRGRIFHLLAMPARVPLSRNSPHTRSAFPGHLPSLLLTPVADDKQHDILYSLARDFCARVHSIYLLSLYLSILTAP